MSLNKRHFDSNFKSVSSLLLFPDQDYEIQSRAVADPWGGGAWPPSGPAKNKMAA